MATRDGALQSTGMVELHEAGASGRTVCLIASHEAYRKNRGKISERRGWLLVIPRVGHKVQLTWTNWDVCLASHRVSFFSENN